MSEEKKEKKEKHFWCVNCKRHWKTSDYEEDDGHWWTECEHCHNMCHDVPHYYANLRKMHKNATGPKTKKGKNRSKMNGYKHGLYAKSLNTLAPALFGHFLECKDCDYKDECEEGRLNFCPIKINPLLKFLEAYKSGRVSDTRELAAMSQSKMYLVVEQIFSQLFNKGVAFTEETPSGEVYKANPLLRDMDKVVSTLGFSADQQKMTPKSDDANGEEPEGSLKITKDAGKFMAEMTKNLAEVVANVTKKADKNRNDDEIFQKYNPDKEQKEEEPDTTSHILKDNPFKNDKNK